jgi:xylan 1,4-beta-xylosidase
MINFQGIPKPTFHAYRLLNTLGTEILERTANGIITRDAQTRRSSALAYHYPPEVTRTVPGSFDTRHVAEATLATGSPAEFVVALEGLVPGTELVLEIIDPDHGDALSAWKRMGSPEPLSREQAKQLKDAAWATQKAHHTVGGDGTFRISKTLAPWSLLSIRHAD